MRRYAVEVTEAASAAIATQARYIAVDSFAPVEAEKWLERIWDAVDSLERWPRRASKAAEDAFVEYEVRQLVVGSHLLLFSVDDDRKLIRIVGLRHGHRLPRPSDLPRDTGSDRSS